MKPFLIMILIFGLVACGESKVKYTNNDVNPKVSQANNEFAFKLYKGYLAKESKNSLISPLSIHMALIMAMNGASEKTKEAMAKVLQVNKLSIDQLNVSYAAVKEILEQADPHVKLQIANSLWMREGKTFHETFLEQNKEKFDAEIASLNFDSPEAPKTMNKWVEKQTKGKIKKIVPNEIDSDTVLFLLNAIYFKGDWITPFSEHRTLKSEFYLDNGQQKQHPFMHQEGTLSYFKGESFQAIKLPYGEERMSMMVFLPDQTSSLEQFYQKLTQENWKRWIHSFKDKQGMISLPKFKIEYETTLTEPLKKMGMEIAFAPTQANFENMADIPPNIYMSKVKHKSFIEVNEKGSEAAAATSVEMKAESAVEYDFQMPVNRPFFFTIVDHETGMILFMGSMKNPKE